MAINAQNGGMMKPVEKSRGILWYAEAGDVATDTITADADLATIGLTEAGAVTTDGVTIESNAGDTETYLDWNGVTFDSSESTSSPTVTFALLEVLGENAAALVYASSAITADEDGNVTAITGTANPTNKTLVLDTRIKNRRVRVVMPVASFSARGDDEYSNEDLYAWEVTYSILSDSQGNDIIRLFADV